MLTLCAVASLIAGAYVADVAATAAFEAQHVTFGSSMVVASGPGEPFFEDR